MKLWHLLILFLILAGSACKNNDDFVDPDRKRSFLHIVNGAEDSPTFEITFDYFNSDNVVISSFFYNRNWPISGYADLEEGGEADEFGHGKLFVTASIPTIVVGDDADTLMPSRTVKLNAEEKATMCFTDSAGTVVFKKFLDEFSAPTDTFALVRFINLKEEVTTANMVSGDGVINVMGVGFLGTSTYMTIPRGTYSIEINDTQSILLTEPSVEIEEGQVYTFYLSGGVGKHKLDSFIH